MQGVFVCRFRLKPGVAEIRQACRKQCLRRPLSTPALAAINHCPILPINCSANRYRLGSLCWTVILSGQCRTGALGVAESCRRACLDRPPFNSRTQDVNGGVTYADNVEGPNGADQNTEHCIGTSHPGIYCSDVTPHAVVLIHTASPRVLWRLSQLWQGSTWACIRLIQIKI